MKLTKLLTPSVLLALAACTTPYSGAGLMQDGTPITGNRVVHTGSKESVSFSSVDGWSCSGDVDLSQMFYDGHTSTTFPVKCSNGATGTVSVAYAYYRRDRLKPGDVAYSFKLSNGQAGQFRV